MPVVVGVTVPEVVLRSQVIARVTGVRVPPGALRSDPKPALANNGILARPGLNSPGLAISSQGALQRARDLTAASAEQLLSAGSAAEAPLVKGQQAYAGTCPYTSHGRVLPSMQPWYHGQLRPPRFIVLSLLVCEAQIVPLWGSWLKCCITHAGSAHNAVRSQASPALLSPLQGGGKPRLSPLNAAGRHLLQRRSSEDPCTYWRFRGRQDFIDHVQTHR